MEEDEGKNAVTVSGRWGRPLAALQQAPPPTSQLHATRGTPHAS